MTWEDLRALSDRGIEIGSHTASHPHLGGLSDRDIRRELTESREHIEDEVHRPCRYFAYPYGEHDRRVRAQVQAAGYEGAFALRAGDQGTGPFAIPRVDIYRADGLLRVAFKASRLYRPLQTFLIALRQGRGQA